ncbi:MAG TPA: hypothetical protein VHV83_11885 [Armatimonadota bacterium]|nr:hypothetical protein [Armatimonadota bacterium]
MTLDEYQGVLAPPSSVSEPLTIVQLQDLLIDTYDGNEEVLQAELAKFSCVRNPDIEEFLQCKALLFEKAHKSRTYIAVSASTLDSESSDLEIFGYFALSLKHLELGEDISKRKQKQLHGLFLPQGNVVVGYLLGQLGKNDTYREAVTGDQLIDAAIGIIQSNAQRTVGGRFVIVECAQHEKLLGFYQRNGFHFLQVDPTDDMAQLVCQIG